MAQNAAPNVTIGNEHAKAYVTCFTQLVERFGDEGREGLTLLFDHEDAAVRCSAAAFLMRYCTVRATRVLQSIAKGRGLTAFEAQCTLKNWANGDWELDVV
jgi:hypothetical protein